MTKQKQTGTMHKISDFQSQRLRQLSLAIVNYIHRAYNCQLLGLVIETVEDDKHVLWLNAVLGSCWPEQWARRHVLQPDGFLSAKMPVSVKASILGKTIQHVPSGDFDRLTTPKNNSDRDIKVSAMKQPEQRGSLARLALPLQSMKTDPERFCGGFVQGAQQVIDAGSVLEVGDGTVQHREPWYSPRSAKAQTKIDSGWYENRGGIAPSVPFHRKPGEKLRSPRTVRLGSIETDSKEEPRACDESPALEAAVPPLTLPSRRDDTMHVDSGPGAGNRSYLYRSSKEHWKSDPGAGPGDPGHSDADVQAFRKSALESSRRPRAIQPEPAERFGVHSDVAMMLSPR